jgi:hypothetical protein
MLGTSIESGGPDVDIVVELLQEYQRTAREAAATDLTDQPWDATRLCGRVADLLERGGRALALLEGPDTHPSSAITWTEADPPVVLARTLAIEFADLHDAVPVFGPGLPRRTPDAQVALAVGLDEELQDLKLAALRTQATQTHGLMAEIGEDRFRAWWREETFVAADRRPSRRADLHDLATSSPRSPRWHPSESLTKPQSQQTPQKQRRQSR